MELQDKLVEVVSALYESNKIDDDEYDMLWQAIEENDLGAFQLYGFESEADIDDFLADSTRLHEDSAIWVVKDSNNKVIKRGLTMQAAYSSLQEPGWTMGVG